MLIDLFSSYNESGVSPVSKRYMRAGIGNDGLFVRISTFTYRYPKSSMSTIA